MLAIEAGTLLNQLARGGDVELAPAQERTLRALLAAGLLAEAPDTSAEERQLAEARAELVRIAAPPGRAPSDAERALRTRILELAERAARAHGAARVRIAGSGPYRASSGSAASFVVTYQARALLSDLAPRLARVGAMPLTEFQRHMQLVREVIGHRARRASVLFAAIRPAAPPGTSEGALRSAAVGLSARNEPEREVAATWAALAAALRREDANDRSGVAEWTADQEAAAAEGMILATADLRTLGRPSAVTVHQRRLELLRSYSNGSAEDALDATMLLANGADLARAAGIASECHGLGMPLTFSCALVAAAAPEGAATRIASAHGRLQQYGEGETPAERTCAAVLIALASSDPVTAVQRARDLRSYLARFAPTGMLVPAALLALLPVETAEALDLLRTASTELQKHKLGGGGAESMTLATKLLLQTAMLARGQEGDPEESAALVRFDALATSQLGLAGLVSQVPLTLTALTAFHRPVLDATLYYQEHHQPTHSPYVFGSGRSTGWG
jgi:hypothetical protein